jgi:hypothetical protein
MSDVNSTDATGTDEPGFRSFTLGDAMILIIAVALGLAIARPAIAVIVNAVGSRADWHFPSWSWSVFMGRWLNLVLLNFLFCLLPAFLILRLRRPRVPLRSIIGQPGFIACAMPVAFVVVALPLSLVVPSGVGERAIEVAAQIVLPAAVPLAWVVLAIMRRWNPEPSWIDRMGRVLGVLWAFCLPAHLVLIRLP